MNLRDYCDMGILFQQFYAMPLSKIRFLMFLLIFAWVYIDSFVKKEKISKTTWKFINIFVSFGIFLAILFTTIISRENTVEVEVILMPFHFLEEAKQQPEIYRSMLMNVFLFFPLGLTLPFSLPERWHGKVLFTILLALLLSTGIEFAQYYFHLGRAETDDVICNTLGAVIGTFSYIMSKIRFERTKKNKDLKVL